MTDQKKEIAELLSGMIDGLETGDIESMIEIPPESKLGDYAFPCFKLAKTMRKAPNLIAQELAEKLAGDSMFSEVKNVSAYVNFFLNRAEVAAAVVSEVLDRKEKYGSSDLGRGKKVIVEYSSPNIAKPFHIGHIRTTVIGNAIYKIFDYLGYETVRINHLGDYGTQFGKMIVAYKLWGEKPVAECNVRELVALYVRFHQEAEDIATFAQALPALASVMKISARWAHDKLKIPEAENENDILGAWRA